ncbi:MAG: hypothetical protein ACM3PV_07835 [Betaproteobacteria bacterium]
MATPVQPPKVSPVDALRDAFDHTRRQLFPIRVEKWLALGLLAFLDQCGRSFRGGAGNGAQWHGGGGGRGGGGAHVAEWIRQAAEWVSLHSALVAGGVVAGVLLVAVLAAIVLWFNARGVFMYLDDVATGRADVARPWRQHALAASSYFAWSLGISLATLFLVLALAGAVATLAVAFATGRLQGTSAWLTGAAMTPVLLLLALALPCLALAALALRDFVAPLQLASGLPCGASARVLEALVLANPGAFVLYLLLKLAIVVGSGIVITILGCLTCCIAFLPVLMQVVFQPLFFFERAFSVFLLRQLGYDVRARLGA